MPLLDDYTYLRDAVIARGEERVRTMRRAMWVYPAVMLMHSTLACIALVAGHYTTLAVQALMLGVDVTMWRFALKALRNTRASVVQMKLGL